MRKAVVILSAFCIGTALVGCTKSKTNTAEKAIPAYAPKQPTPKVVKPAVAVPTTWEIKLNTTCAEETADANCVGKYGFTVDQGGKVKLGPGPNNEVRYAQLEEDKKVQINTLVAAVLASPAEDTLKNETLDEDNNSNAEESASKGTEVISLTPTNANNSTARILVKKEGKELQHAVPSAEDAKKLYSLIHDSAEELSASPFKKDDPQGNYPQFNYRFPDPCYDGATLLRETSVAMLSCQADSDCAILNENFQPYAENLVPDTLTTDSCNLVDPLIVGNSKSVETEKYAEKFLNLQNQCNAAQKSFAKPNCEVKTRGYHGEKPTCVAGQCFLANSVF
jgi:hypothetical protein